MHQGKPSLPQEKLSQSSQNKLLLPQGEKGVKQTNNTRVQDFF